MLKKINDYIDKLPLEVEPKGLYEPIRYVLSLGGKRIRPMLMMMAYEMWCEDNALKPLSSRSFSLYLMENLDTYNLEPTNNIHFPDGKRVRGFMGIRLLQHPFI